MKWIRLDYPLPIAHVLLHDRRDRIPAHSHGCSAALAPSHAISRALFESVQMHHGLARFATAHWEKMAARVETCHSHPRFAWGDPLYSPTLNHLFNTPKTAAHPWRGPSLTVQKLCEFLDKSRRKIFWCTLGKAAGLTVVRVLVEGSVSPDSRLEDRSQRLAHWVRQCKLPGPYTDPILT
jgi:ribosomal protein S12 methylthiotransferase accessory factor YcaO